MKEERKKEKDNRKKQLLLALFMLLVSSITLTTASYAWFTANTNVSVESLDVNVGASNGIQISTDAVNWKAAVTVDEILNSAYTGNTNQVPASIAPVSTDGSVTSGAMNMFSGAIEWSDDDSDYMLTSEALTDTAGTAGQYIAFDIFLLVQQTETLYLTTGSEVVANGSDTGLKNSARVAFLYEGNVAAGNSTGAIALKNATDSVIWEPNNNAHTSAAVDNNNAIYGTTINTTAVMSSYYGVKAAIADPGISYKSTPTTQPDYLAEVEPDLSTGTTMDAYQQVFQLNAGINKIRIYAWVEGQDIDCENNASGSDITFTLKFSKNASA